MKTTRMNTGATSTLITSFLISVPGVEKIVFIYWDSGVVK